MYILQQNLHRSPRATHEILDTADKRTNKIGDCSILFVQEPAVDMSSNIKGFPSSSQVISNASVGDPRSAIVILSRNVHHSALPQFTTFFCSAIKVQYAGKSMIMCSIYLPPNCTIRPFLRHIERVLEEYKDLPILLFGDYNCMHSRWLCRSDTTRGRRLLEFTLNNDLTIFNTPEPSYRHLDGRSSHIDLLLTNQHAVSLVSRWEQLPFNIYTDHSPQITVIGGSQTQLPRRQLSTWRFSERDVDWGMFVDSFDAAEIDSCFDRSINCNSKSEVDFCLRFLSDLIVESAYKSLPIKKPPSHRSFSRKVWWDRDVLTFHRDVKRSKNKVRRCTNSVVRRTLVSRYLMLKERFERLCKTKSEASWRHFVCDGDESEAKNWGNGYRFIQFKMSNDVRSDQFLEGDCGAVTSRFRSLLDTFFPSDINTVAALLNHESSFEFPQHSTQKLKNLIKQSNKKKAPGLDHISNTMIKNLPNALVLALQNIFSCCLRLGYFPDSWKISAVKIIPKPNKVDYSLASSYRPISLTSNLSKLLEKIINAHLTFFLESNDVIHCHQYGFRAGRSTADALQRVLKLALRPGMRNAIVSFDFRSAFDFAPHSIIIQELVSCNAPEFLVAMVSSYLSNRRVIVKLSDTTIEHEPVGRGCPQGGILSPILWSIVVNSLLIGLETKGFDTTAYADDLTVICRGKNDAELRNNINTVTKIVKEWSASTGIHINFDKSNALPIGQRSIPALQGIDLKIVQSTVILGVTFVRSLKFDTHVKKKLSSISRYIDIVRRYFSKSFGLTCDSKCILYNCYVKPMILYAAEVWGNRINVNTIRSLRTFENAIIRNAVHGFKSTSSDSMHALTSIPFINDLINERVLAFGCRSKLAPTFPNNPLLNNISIVNREYNPTDVDLSIYVRCRRDPGTNLLICRIVFESLNVDLPDIMTKYGQMTDTEDAVANGIRKALKAIARIRSSVNAMVVFSQNPACLHADRVRVSKNSQKVLTYLKELDCLLYVKHHSFNASDEPIELESIRVSKISYPYSSMTSLKRRLNSNLQMGIDAALGRCRDSVQTIASCRLYHRRLLNQSTITYITEHGPTRAYLAWRHVISSDLCPTCNVPETYDHITYDCPRFQRLQMEFGTDRFTDTDELIVAFIDQNIFSKFCHQLFLTLRSFNSTL